MMLKKKMKNKIILDKRMIDEIDHSRDLLYDISQRIAVKKKTLLDIEQQMDIATNSALIIRDALHVDRVTGDTQKLFPDYNMELCNTQGPLREERVPDFGPYTRSRDLGDSRKLSPANDIIMNMDTNEEESLPSQRFRSLSGRRTSPTVPGAGTSPSRACSSPV